MLGENEDSYVQSYIQTQSTGIACETVSIFCVAIIFQHCLNPLDNDKNPPTPHFLIPFKPSQSH